MYVKLKVFFEHLGKFLCLMELSSEMQQRTPPPPLPAPELASRHSFVLWILV
jgi:hypothetical protein